MRDFDANFDANTGHERDNCVNNGTTSSEEDSLILRDKSIELRKGLEQLMEHIQSHRHEESSESFEERYLLLVSSYPPKCLNIAVTLTDDDVMRHGSSLISSTEASLRLPIHLACDKAAPLSIVKSLLDADSNNDGDHPSIHRADKWGDLPIHIACSRASAAPSAEIELYGRRLDALGEAVFDPNSHATANDAVESIRLLLEADKDKKTLSVKDVYESLPLHTAARYNAPVEVISMLLEGGQDGENRGLYTEGLHGQFPLTVACRSGSPRPEVLRILLEHDDASASSSRRRQDGNQQPSTILHKDTTGRLPIHVFMLRNTCEVCLRILLEAMLGRTSRTTYHNRSKFRAVPNRNSILEIGLDSWKRQCNAFLADMDGTNLYERDFTTRDKLDVICAQVRVFYEICVNLELVAWRMSCLSGIRDEQEKSDGGSINTNVWEDGQYKRDRRIVSGTEIIVPNVLSFLEDEPVERILEQFRSYGYLGKKS